MQPLGWGAPAATNGAWQPCGMDGVEAAPAAQVDPQELSELASRALRVLLGAEHWLPLSCLRLAVLGSTHDSRRCAGRAVGLPRSLRRSNTAACRRLSSRPARRLTPSHPCLCSLAASACWSWLCRRCAIKVWCCDRATARWRHCR